MTCIFLCLLSWRVNASLTSKSLYWPKEKWDGHLCVCGQVIRGIGLLVEGERRKLRKRIGFVASLESVFLLGANHRWTGHSRSSSIGRAEFGCPQMCVDQKRWKKKTTAVTSSFAGCVNRSKFLGFTKKDEMAEETKEKNGNLLSYRLKI